MVTQHFVWPHLFSLKRDSVVTSILSAAGNIIRTHNLEQLIGPPVTYNLSLESQKAVFNIPKNLPLSDSEKSVLCKGL